MNKLNLCKLDFSNYEIYMWITTTYNRCLRTDKSDEKK